MRPVVADPVPQRSLRPLALVVALLLGLCGALVAPPPASAFDEGTIHSLANQARAANGLGPLALNSSLSRVAAGWANKMAASGKLSHNPNFGSQIPGGWTKAGENVAKGYATGSAVHQGWMNSREHRANILGDYTDIGIAHISGGGTTWSVQVFAKYGATVPAPAPPPPPPAPKPKPAPAPAPAPEAEPMPGSEPEPSEADESDTGDSESPGGSESPSPEPEQSDTATGQEDATGPSPDEAEADAFGQTTTKLVLGIAFLLSLAAVAAGWLRLRRVRP